MTRCRFFLTLLAGVSAWPVFGAPPHRAPWLSDSGCPVEISSWTGAYYRKWRSPARFDGFYGVAILPTYRTDPNRYYHVDHRDANQKQRWEGPMDHTSLYVGASNPDTNSEIDTGITFEQVWDSQKRLILTKAADIVGGSDPSGWYRVALNPSIVLTDPRGEVLAKGWPAIEEKVRQEKLHYYFAFRPFYRYNDSTGNVWNSESDLFFLPGERPQISLTHQGNNFRIAVVSGAKSYVREFRVLGFSDHGRGYPFKRVNSIDQYRLLSNGLIKGNEGPTVRVIPTKAAAIRTGWQEAWLLKSDGGRVPFTAPNAINTRGRDTAPQYDKIFHDRSGIGANGGELFDIN